MNKDTSKTEFKLPAGFSVPEGKGVGDSIEVLATVELKEGGMACLTKLGGAPMPGYDAGDHQDKPDAAPTGNAFASQYMGAMGAAPPAS